MVSVILHGCSGHMGQVVTDIIAADPDIEIVAGIDAVDLGNREYPVFTDAAECSVPTDAIIDFSTAKAVDVLLAYAVERNIPVVSANMSLGVNLLLKLLREASGTLTANGFDPEIIEMHHRRKIDAPSGTAIALADAVNEGSGNQYHYVYDRTTRREARGDREMGISAVRGGTIVGVHDVLFAGQDEVIEFTHTAYSRAIFGKGAVAAAKFLAGRGAGLYDMADVIG